MEGNLLDGSSVLLSPSAPLLSCTSFSSFSPTFCCSPSLSSSSSSEDSSKASPGTVCRDTSAHTWTMSHDDMGYLALHFQARCSLVYIITGEERTQKQKKSSITFHQQNITVCKFCMFICIPNFLHRLLVHILKPYNP